MPVINGQLGGRVAANAVWDLNENCSYTKLVLNVLVFNLLVASVSSAAIPRMLFRK